MALKSDLFELIKSLSKSEKRHFKLHCGLHHGSKNYQRLFEAIDRQSHYDEQAIKELFAGEPFIMQLHVTKYYLRGLIMKSVRSYQAGSSKSVEARQYLRDAEILFNKELFRQAEETLEKAGKIARRYELDAVLCEVLDLKRSLVQNEQPHQFEVLARVIADQGTAIARLTNRNQYIALIIDVTKAIFSNTPNSVQNEEWLDSPEQALTLEAQVMHYNARYFRQVQQGDAESAELTLLGLINKLEASDFRIQESPGLYVSTINNVISFYVYNKQYDAAMELIQRSKVVYEQWNLKNENRTLLKQVLRTYSSELEIIRNHSLHVTPADTINSVAYFVQRNAKKMPSSYLLLFWFQLAYIYFMRGNLKNALHHVNQLIQTRHRQVQNEVHVHARFLNLMIHLEQENQFVLRYFVESARRFLKKHNVVSPYEMALLRFFSKMGRTGRLDRKQRYRDLFDQLYPSKGESLIPKSASAYIDYKTWIQTQLA